MSLISDTRRARTVPDHILIQRQESTGVYYTRCLHCGDGIGYAGTLKEWGRSQLEAHCRQWALDHECKGTPDM